MLSITTTAQEAINGILSSPNAPEEAGVRIEADDGGPEESQAGFRLAVVPTPAEDDQVIADGKVFVEPRAAELLDSSELDAEVDEGQVQFKLQHADAA